MKWKDVKLKQAKQIFILQSQTGQTDAYLYGEMGKILSLDRSNAFEAKSHIDELLQDDLSEELTQFTFCDNKYGLHYDLSTLNFGCFIDQELRMENDVDPVWFNTEQILATVIRPIKKENLRSKIRNFTKKKIREAESRLLNNQYQIDDYEGNQRNLTAIDLLELPITELYPVVFFFLRIGLKYTETLITSLLPDSQIQS